jgi:hypothetical protein
MFCMAIYLRLKSLEISQKNVFLAGSRKDKHIVGSYLVRLCCWYSQRKEIICFLWLKEQSVPFEKRTKSFASPRDLTKYLSRSIWRTLKKEIRLDAGPVKCRCRISRSSESRRGHPWNSVVTA